jgi:hypothetical protein
MRQICGKGSLDDRRQTTDDRHKTGAAAVSQPENKTCQRPDSRKRPGSSAVQRARAYAALACVGLFTLTTCALVRLQPPTRLRVIGAGVPLRYAESWTIRNGASCLWRRSGADRARKTASKGRSGSLSALPGELQRDLHALASAPGRTSRPYDRACARFATALGMGPAANDVARVEAEQLRQGTSQVGIGKTASRGRAKMRP